MALFLMSALFVPTAGAAAVVHFTTVEQVPIGAPVGTYSAAGDITDAGAFVFETFRSQGPFVPVVTEHIVETYSGEAGSLTIRQQCLSTFAGFFFADTCNVVLIDGSGAYSDLRGTGKCQGVINLITGVASRTCDYTLVRP
jgi:hypothetical protein